MKKLSLIRFLTLVLLSGFFCAFSPLEVNEYGIESNDFLVLSKNDGGGNQSVYGWPCGSIDVTINLHFPTIAPDTGCVFPMYIYAFTGNFNNMLGVSEVIGLPEFGPINEPEGIPVDLTLDCSLIDFVECNENQDPFEVPITFMVVYEEEGEYHEYPFDNCNLFNEAYVEPNSGILTVNFLFACMPPNPFPDPAYQLNRHNDNSGRNLAAKTTVLPSTATVTDDINTHTKLFPNPVKNELTLSWHSAQDGPVEIYASGLDGKRRTILRSHFPKGEQQILIDTKGWPAGLSVLTLQTPETTHILKVVKAD